jgi:hypothetical protein
MNSDNVASAGAFPLPYREIQSPAPLARARHFASVGGEYSVPFALIRMAVLTIAPFIQVDAAMYQLEMLATGGGTPITPALLKVAMMGALGIGFLFRGRMSNAPIVNVALTFIAYLVIAALHQYFNLGVDFFDILLAYDSYYLLPLICAFALSVPVKIPDRTLVILSVVLALVCGGLGIAQYVTNSPIVRTSSSDGYFKVLVWSTFGHIRVFSLFTAPATCSAYFCFTASLAVAMSRRKKLLVVAIPLLILSFFMSWASDARTNIIGTACGVVSAWVITYVHKQGRTKWLPYLWLLVGICVATYAYSRALSGGLSTGAVTDASSFAERFARWSTIIEMFRSTSVFNLLFGYGLVQGGKLDPTGTGGSDNLYLAYILHIGIVGLCLMMMLFWNLWQVVRKEAETRDSYLATAVAATYSTLLLNAIYSVSPYGMIFLFFAISDRHAAKPRQAHKEPSGAGSLANAQDELAPTTP